MRQKKLMTKKQYKILSMVWMLAAAAMAVAFVRQISVRFNLVALLLLVLSLLLSTGFWKAYKTAPEEGDINKKLEEKNHE